MVTMVAPAALAGGGVQGPNPIANGEFDAAVPGTHAMAGWTAHSITDPTHAHAEVIQVDGDNELKTLANGGYLMSPSNLGFSMERPAYSLLFGELTFEVTDTAGEDVGDSGLHVMVLAEWTDKWLAQTQEDPTATDPDPETSIAIFWDDVSSQEARDGLTLANADGIKGFDGSDISYEMSDFSDEELANAWTMGGLKIGLPHDQQVVLDGFEITEPTLFGTYR